MVPPPLWPHGLLQPPPPPPPPGCLNSVPPLQHHKASSDNGANMCIGTYAPVPITTVIGVEFDKGCILASNTVHPSHPDREYRECPRMIIVNDRVVVGTCGDSGEYAYLKSLIGRIYGGKNDADVQNIHHWLTTAIAMDYKNVIRHNFIVAGVMANGEPFLGAIDKMGGPYRCRTYATGVDDYMVTSLLRNVGGKERLDEKNARTLVSQCLEVLYYRDDRPAPRYEMAVVTSSGVVVDYNMTFKRD